MPSTHARLRTAMVVPHGAVPDQRGFAPAIVAWNFARHMQGFAPFLVSAQEHYKERYEVVSGIPVHRIHEGRMYRRLFKKVLRLDPYPLHRRLAAILNHEPWGLLHAQQLEVPIRDFFRHARARRPVLLHAQVTTNPFDPARGVADRYVAISHFVRERLVE